MNPWIIGFASFAFGFIAGVAALAQTKLLEFSMQVPKPPLVVPETYAELEHFLAGLKI